MTTPSNWKKWWTVWCTHLPRKPPPRTGTLSLTSFYETCIQRVNTIQLDYYCVVLAGVRLMMTHCNVAWLDVTWVIDCLYCSSLVACYSFAALMLYPASRADIVGFIWRYYFLNQKLIVGQQLPVYFRDQFPLSVSNLVASFFLDNNNEYFD